MIYESFKDDEEEESGDKPIISFDDLTRLLDKMHNYVDELDMDGMETVMEEMSKYSFSQGEIAFYNKLKELLVSNNLLDFVKEAFIKEKEVQELLDIKCEAVIDGYTDFIFVNRFGNVQHQGTLNKAIKRIIRDCNDEQFLKSDNPKVLLPHFSCHSLRHTFTTRMCEAGVNVKVIQDTLGHTDVSTTLNIYTDVTKELKRVEFEGLDRFFKNA